MKEINKNSLIALNSCGYLVVSQMSCPLIFTLYLDFAPFPLSEVKVSLPSLYLSGFGFLFLSTPVAHPSRGLNRVDGEEKGSRLDGCVILLVT